MEENFKADLKQKCSFNFEVYSYQSAFQISRENPSCLIDLRDVIIVAEYLSIHIDSH